MNAESASILTAHAPTPTIGELVDIKVSAPNADDILARAITEEMITEAVRVITKKRAAKAGVLKRQMKLPGIVVNDDLVSRILQELETRGLIGPHKDSEPRAILFELPEETKTVQQQIATTPTAPTSPNPAPTVEQNATDASSVPDTSSSATAKMEKVFKNGGQRQTRPKSVFLCPETMPIWRGLSLAFRTSVRTEIRDQAGVVTVTGKAEITVIKNSGEVYGMIYYADTAYVLGSVGPTTKNSESEKLDLRFLEPSELSIKQEWSKISFLPRWNPSARSECAHCLHLHRRMEKTTTGDRKEALSCGLTKAPTSRTATCDSYKSGGKITNSKGIFHGPLTEAVMTRTDEEFVSKFLTHLGVPNEDRPMSVVTRKMFVASSGIDEVFNFSITKDSGQSWAVVWDKTTGEELGGIFINNFGEPKWEPRFVDGESVLQSRHFPSGVGGMAMVAIGYVRHMTGDNPVWPM